MSLDDPQARRGNFARSEMQVSGTKGSLKRIIELTAVRLLKRPGTIAVFLRGSQVSKQLTPTSDVDLIVVNKGSSPKVEAPIIRGVPFHIRTYPIGYIRMSLRIRNPRMTEFLVNSRPLLDPSKVHRQITRALRFFPKKFVHDVMIIASHEINDAQGQFKLGNYESAILLSRTATTELAKAILLRRGDKVFKEKYVANGLRRTRELRSINTIFRSVHGLQGVSKEKAKRIMFDAIRLYDRVSSEIPGSD